VSLFWDNIGLWIQFFLVLAIFSITLIKDNPTGNIGEIAFIVGSWSNFLIRSLDRVQANAIQPILNGNLIKIIPLLMGLMFIFMYYKPMHQISRWPAAIIVGTSMGLSFRGMLETRLIGQVKASLLPITGVSSGQAFNNLYIMLTTVIVVIYFTFSVGLKPGSPISYVRSAARKVIMLMFGVGMAASVWYSSGLIIAKFQWLVAFVQGTL
jgi:hypothetical protein